MNKNHKFDEQVKQKLGGIHTPPMYGSWESFQHKRESALSNSADENNEAFDARIKSKIGKIHKTNASDHWEKLRYKLETIELFREKIWLHKAKELLAVLLFLFTFYNVMLHEGRFAGENKAYALQSVENKSEGLAQRNINDLKQRKVALPFGHEVKKEYQKDENTISGSGTSRTMLFVENLRNDGISKFPKSVLTAYSSSGTGEGMVQLSSISYAPGNTGSETRKEDIAKIVALQTEPYSLYAAIIPMTFYKGRSNVKQTRFGIHFAHVDNFILSPYDKVYSIPKFSNSMRNQ